MKKYQFLSLLIAISFVGCNNVGKKSSPALSSIDVDFPTAEQLEFTPFNTYDIFRDGTCVIDGSILWYVEDRKDDFGVCYDLNTGEKLSVIVSKGMADNELIDLAGFAVTGDSVLLYTNRNAIKTFAKKDIVGNIPMGDRKVSVTTAPRDIFVNQMMKLPNGSVLATIRPAFEFEKENTNAVNKSSVVVFNNNDVTPHEVIKYDSFDVGKATGKQIDENDLIKWSYAQGTIEIKDNDMAVFSVHNQFMLYTFDINTGKVVNEKRYTEMLREKSEMSLTSTNDMSQSIRYMKVNDKYILCWVRGYLSEEDKNLEQPKEAIFVFDWDLKPVKRFDLPDPEGKNGYYCISNDCSSVYFCEYYRREGLTLHKAVLNI